MKFFMLFLLGNKIIEETPRFLDSNQEIRLLTLLRVSGVIPK
ncbi:hypothetical protein SAMN05443144_12077 [Fodinibius roseus]|uniref:Uncharacterized protein n=1 Tax=Fodinibius roseus TaxID=1194090 RepID=A0A1M5HLF4_9BACT|nr:hypothetical protein SAMN05443144_12077 [Fodinibius roseus]